MEVKIFRPLLGLYLGWFPFFKKKSSHYKEEICRNVKKSNGIFLLYIISLVCYSAIFLYPIAGTEITSPLVLKLFVLHLYVCDKNNVSSLPFSAISCIVMDGSDTCILCLLNYYSLSFQEIK